MATKPKRRTLRGIDAKHPVSTSKSCKITTNPGFVRVNINDVEQCANLCSSHWFDKASMKFFGSRVDHIAYADGKGGAYFVSSEKRPRSDDPRAYSVRHYSKCAVNTVGEFQGHKTKAQAVRAIVALIGPAKFHASERPSVGLKGAKKRSK